MPSWEKMIYSKLQMNNCENSIKNLFDSFEKSLETIMIQLCHIKMNKFKVCMNLWLLLALQMMKVLQHSWSEYILFKMVARAYMHGGVTWDVVIESWSCLTGYKKSVRLSPKKSLGNDLT